MTVAAVIVNWNQAGLAERAALSVREDVERIYLLDNGSAAADHQRLKAFSREHNMTFLRSETNLGFAGGNNVCIERAISDGSRFIFLLNSDAVALPGCVGRLAERLRVARDVAAVAPTVLDMDTGEVLHVGTRLDLRTGATGWLDRGMPIESIDLSPRDVGYAPGEAVLMRREALLNCGLFDERYFCYFEDAEWSARVRSAGWRLEVMPEALVRHLGGGSNVGYASQYFMARNRVLFLRWGLAMSYGRSLALSTRTTAIQVGALIRRRSIAAGCRGALAGWVVGLVKARRNSPATTCVAEGAKWPCVY